MKIIFLIIVGLSLLQADFTKTGNIVKDSLSKLEWQDDAVGSSTTWQAAIDRCEALELDGYSDWRLPNINELKSIVDRSKVNPAIAVGFENTSSNYYYWSTTSYEKNKSYARAVFFNYGRVDSYAKGNNAYVRCVR